MYLARRVAASIARVALVCGAIALAACLIRLLPWIASGAVPLRATAAFAQSLALAALEIVLIVAPPLGVSLELARAASDGVTRALFCAGAGPWRQLRQVALAASLAALPAMALSSAWGWQASRPGRLVNQVLAAGRSACEQGPRQAPLVQMTWLCSDGVPIMVGQLGGSPGSCGLYTAESASFSDDLGSLRLLNVQARTVEPLMHARFGAVTVTGLIPWIAASPLPPFVRGLSCALAAVAASIGSAWALLRRVDGSRAVALAIGASGPAAFLLAWPPLFRYGSAGALLLTTLLSLSTPVLVGTALSALRLPCLFAGGTNRERAG